MLILESIAKIRRAFFVQGKSIKLICRELRVSRKVVRKVIRSEATEFRYEREAQPLPSIGPWTDQLDELLLANEGKAARERLTLIGPLLPKPIAPWLLRRRIGATVSSCSAAMSRAESYSMNISRTRPLRSGRSMKQSSFSAMILC